MSDRKEGFDTWISLDGIESERTYFFPDSLGHTITSPVKLYVKKSGSHRLVDKEGRMHYIRDKWLYFTAIGEWDFTVEAKDD